VSPACLTAILTIGAAVSFTPPCATQRVSLNEGVREYTATDYASVLKRWTREEKLIDLSEIDSPLTVTATYESWDFRWAYVIKYAEDYRLTVEQRRQLLDKTLAETRTLHSFYIALYGTKWRWSDLSKPGSAWVVRLIDEKGNETAPSSIDPIVKPGAIEYKYFPYTTVWRHVFRINFPVTRGGENKPTIDPQAKWFGLRFAGAEGHDELHWDLETPEEKKAAFGPSHTGKYLE
jgi:hypothetical protein